MNKKDFIIFADLPPSPFDDELIKDYLELGFNVILLTEDNVDMVEDGRLSSEYKKAINNLSKHDIDIWIRNMYNDPDYFDCGDPEKERSNYGTPYSLTERHLTDEFKEFPSVTGFYMSDEPYMKQLEEHPSYASFDRLVKLVDYRNKCYENHFFHMNMVPSSSWDHYYQIGNDILDYKDFIDEYINTIIKRITNGNKSVCLDNYPFVGKDYIDPSYLNDLLLVANTTRDYNSSVNDKDKATFGICIQAFDCYSPLGDKHRDIALPSEISFQVLTGLCLNAHLFEYFAFCSIDVAKIHGIFGGNKKKRIYNIVKEGNDYSFKFFDYIKGCEWLGADFYHGSTKEFSNPVHLHKDLFFKDHHSIKNIKCDYDVLLGCFKKSGKDAFMVINYTDPQKNHQNKIEIKFDKFGKIAVFDGDNEKIISNDSYEIVLKPGEGAFICLE